MSESVGVRPGVRAPPLSPVLPADRDPIERELEFADLSESLPTCFERIASKYPERPALGSGTWDATYFELNTAADRLAAVLCMRAGVPGDRVAILMRHDTPLVVAMLAGLKAGRVVVVLNPTDPPARLRWVIGDAEPAAMVVDAAHAALARSLTGPSCRLIAYDEPPGVDSGEAPGADVEVSPVETAFLVYTSGSTGSPRGVMLSHRQVLRNARTHGRTMDVTPGDRIALLVSPSGGLGVTVAWCALMCGASLHPFPTMDKGVVGLAAWLGQHGITMYMSTASLFRNFVAALGEGVLVPGVCLVRLSSEPATSEDFTAFRRHFPDADTFVHTLGTTETGNIAHFRRSRRDAVAEGLLPIGHPASGIEILLQDEQGRAVGRGEPGEIVVRGRFLSPGYWRDPALTNERFTHEGDGVRSFRTGDVARLNADGLLEFLGRRDDRVKIRGFRVELAEVEHALRQLPEVDRSVVSVLAQPGREPQLIAHVVPRSGERLVSRTLRRALRRLVPEHMVPSAFVGVDGFPLTPHGKIDRSALLRAHPPTREGDPTDSPRTETEAYLAALWAEVLDLPEVGRVDDFFDLGGDSLAAAVIGARLHDALGVEIDLATFDDHSTLAALADVVDARRRAGTTDRMLAPTRPRRGAPAPLSLLQERVWKFSGASQAPDGYTKVGQHCIRGVLDVGLLHECMSYIARRHEILRTTFVNQGGRPVQLVHSPATVSLSLLDLAGTPDAERRATTLFAQNARVAIDRTAGPLLRFTLARVRADEHWLFRVSHQLIGDGWSWRIYFRELATLYEARRRGDNFPLPAFEPFQYGDYATWQRERLGPGGSDYERMVSWWTSHLLGVPAQLGLPFLRQAPCPGVDPAEGLGQWGLPAQVSHRLADLGRDCRATYHVVRLAAFLALLSAEIGERDVVVGIHVNTRNRVAAQNLLGYFVNLVTLRVRCDPARPFRQWLSEVRATVIAAGSHGELPYELLRDELSNRGIVVPEIHVIFGTSTYQPVLRFADLTLTTMHPPMQGMPWGLSVLMSEHDEEVGCFTAFDAGRYEPARVQDFIARLARLLTCLASYPEMSVGDLVALSGDRPPSVPAV